MYPDIEYVLKKRYALSLIVRCCAIVLFLLGALPLLQLILQTTLGLMFEMFYVQILPGTLDWKDILLYVIPEICKYAIPGWLLLHYRLRIVRWIAPMPKPVCPHCGYDISKLAEPRCPECGMELPREMVTQADSD